MSIWRSPIVPISLAFTAGIMIDRFWGLPFLVSLAVAAAGLAAWCSTRFSRLAGLPLIYLLITVGAIGAARHHQHRSLYNQDDIGNLIDDTQRIALVRGILHEEPIDRWVPSNNPLKSPRGQKSGSEDEEPREIETATATIEVESAKQDGRWMQATGLLRLVVSGRPGKPQESPLDGLHAGDEIEVVGMLVRPRGPANPGEFDYASYLQDQRIRAQLIVKKTPDAITRIAEGWTGSWKGWLAVIRGWGQRVLQARLPRERAAVAEALLLGEGSAMTNDDWDKYIRTGVIHVLAISGQHLVILGAVVWFMVRLLQVRRARAAWLVAAGLMIYSLLTGGNPPVMRSAVMVCVYCGGLILRRQTMLANSFGLAWLLVAILNPADLFNAGCQLSFLSVAVLYWGTGRLWRRENDPLEKLIEASKPFWQRSIRKMFAEVGKTYAVTGIIWLAIVPLVMARYQTISFVGLLIGPPVVVLSSIALISGFVLLLVSPLGDFAAALPTFLTRISLAGCDGLVHFGDQLPFGHMYAGNVPNWWLWVFYLGLLFVLTHEAMVRRWKWMLLATFAWIVVGLGLGAMRPHQDEFRCTFLAVGHGGCTVMETPDGRTLLYDAGAISGPDVTRRVIAPYLWSRGIRRIDEVFLSHADLDHYNGLPALLERFAVGQVTCTPTFADKSNDAVRYTIAELSRWKIPTRIVRAGDQLQVGPLAIEVLHPPAVGPDGSENARSMVLLLRHEGHTILLTGDLELAGMDQVLSLEPPGIDILMAPHHGSAVANKTEFAAWAKSKLVVSCEGPPRGTSRPLEPYSRRGATFWPTYPLGAVTIRSHSTGLIAESFQRKQPLVIRRGKGT